MPVNSIEALFISQLRDIYDAEKRLTRALPKLAKAVETEELKKALEEHLEITRDQVSRVERVFGIIGARAQAKTCEAMKGLIEEGDESAGESGARVLVDLGIVGAARRVEHYEMAAYKTLISLAGGLQQSEELQELLRQSLEEEEEADRSLAEVCEALVERSGASEDREGEEEDEVTVTTARGKSHSQR